MINTATLEVAVLLVIRPVPARLIALADISCQLVWLWV
jgi:hypothetical protein